MGSRGRARHAAEAGEKRVKASARLRPRGFWRGLASGVALAAAAALALAYVFPPFFAPSVDPVTQVAPAAPAVPAGTASPTHPRPAALPANSGQLASLVPLRQDSRPDSGDGAADRQEPAAAALIHPLAPPLPASGVAPVRPGAGRSLLAPAAGMPLLTVSDEIAPDMRGALPAPTPTVGAGTPSLVPPQE